jgi:transposase InsO family protein
MENHKDQFPIAKMSLVLGVSRSGYYKWRGRKPSKREQANKEYTKQIRRIWRDSNKTYGSPRIHQQLLKEGAAISRPRVARLMREAGIASQIRRKWTKTTDSSHQWPVALNLLDRHFAPDSLGEAWVSDITYLPSSQGWLYLTSVMDLADRQIIGWTLSDTMKAAQTTVPAFQAACQQRPPVGELIFHSDRGSQYGCQEFTAQLKTHPQISQSMSRKGNCWDNAPAESFFKTLKAELPIQTKDCNYRQVRRALFVFIEIWYNRKRLHSSLDYRTPAQMEQYLIQQQKQEQAA